MRPGYTLKCKWRTKWMRTTSHHLVTQRQVHMRWIFLSTDRVLLVQLLLTTQHCYHGPQEQQAQITHPAEAVLLRSQTLQHDESASPTSGSRCKGAPHANWSTSVQMSPYLVLGTQPCTRVCSRSFPLYIYTNLVFHSYPTYRFKLLFWAKMKQVVPVVRRGSLVQSKMQLFFRVFFLPCFIFWIIFDKLNSVKL